MNYPIFLDSEIFSAGPVTIRWYGLMYVLAFVVCYLLGMYRANQAGSAFQKPVVYDIVFYGVIGAIIGGRVGYAMFYGTDLLLANPLWIFKIWEGGMSFHGGLLGVALALWIYGRRRKHHFLDVSDFMAPLVPIGLGFGRIGNYINIELPGRITDSFLGVHFPCSAVRTLNPLCFGEWETQTRHLSSLYQAAAEGVALFLIVWLFSMRHRARGAVSGVFLIAYGMLRILTECFRHPDPGLGYIASEWLTMGQLLSIPMVLFGAYLWFFYAKHQSPQVDNT